MRRLFIFSLIGSLCIMFVSAGNAQERKNRIGIVGGHTYGTQLMNPDPAKAPTANIDDTHEWISGYSFGIRFERQVRENFIFTPEIIFAYTGDGFYHLNLEKASDPPPFNQRFSEFHNYFIMVPLTYKLVFRNLGLPFEPYLIGGPELGFLVRCTQEPYVTVGIMDVKDAPTDAKKVNAMRTSTWALTFGGGFSFNLPNSPLSMFADVRFSQSFQSYNDNNHSLDTKDINYRIFYSTFGIIF
ncbi:hypothetical protein AMJ80_04695 [bacterium SM23_31]|nr:MAG: hypothetical protein AMJ80_04695 [bacterium SM23_31]